MKSELACSFEEVRRERDGCRAALHEAAAEIERLREGERAADAEIERLREELAVEKGWVSQYRDSYCKQVVEIERLRAEADLRAKQLQTHIVALLDAEKVITGLQNANQDLVDERDIFKRTLDKRDAEIERLRGEAERRSRVEDERSQRAVEMEKEIERLREQAENDRQAINATHTVQAELRAEIERLRKELAREEEEHNRCTTFHAIAVKERNYERVLSLQKDAEIKRLRGQVEEAAIHIPAHAAITIEQLREELSHCLHLDNHNAIVRNLQEATVVVTAEKDAEIELLSGLLRDGLTSNVPEWKERVREALGEGNAT